MNEGAGKLRTIVHSQPLRIAVKTASRSMKAATRLPDIDVPTRMPGDRRVKSSTIVKIRSLLPPAQASERKSMDQTSWGFVAAASPSGGKRCASSFSFFEGKTLLPVNALGSLMVHNQFFTPQ